jgi:uncharacterized membrane protein YkvA (DUF1232 family)
MKKNPSPDQIKEEFLKRTQQVKESDIENLLKDSDKLIQKVLSSSQLKKEIAKVKLLLMMVKDYWNGTYREIPYGTIIAIAVALIYILSPLDLIPDFIPVIGQMDDLAMLLFVWDRISEDVKQYALWKIKQGHEDVKNLFVEAFDYLPSDLA